MPAPLFARRSLLRTPLLFVPGVLEALQHAHQTVRSSTPHIQYLEPDEASEIEALASALIPSDGSPGAKEAGVIYFIDRALATFDASKRRLYRDGLAAAQVKRRTLIPNSASIAALTPAQLVTLVESIEKTPFFDALRTHTVTGFFASPEWGGNRGKIGWKLIGFEDKFAFEPPFGYYDNPENAE